MLLHALQFYKSSFSYWSTLVLGICKQENLHWPHTKNRTFSGKYTKGFKTIRKTIPAIPTYVIL